MNRTVIFVDLASSRDPYTDVTPSSGPLVLYSLRQHNRGYY
jgi:hypothetical protein